MAGSSAEHIQEHVKVYYRVFAALAVLTVVTVAVAEFRHLSTPVAVSIALLIACVKGSLVCCYFMHLMTEKKMLYSILILCVFFFFMLLLIPMITTEESVHLPKAVSMGIESLRLGHVA